VKRGGCLQASTYCLEARIYINAAVSKCVYKSLSGHLACPRVRDRLPTSLGISRCSLLHSTPPSIPSVGALTPPMSQATRCTRPETGTISQALFRTPTTVSPSCPDVRSYRVPDYSTGTCGFDDVEAVYGPEPHGGPTGTTSAIPTHFFSLPVPTIACEGRCSTPVGLRFIDITHWLQLDTQPCVMPTYDTGGEWPSPIPIVAEPTVYHPPPALCETIILCG